MVMRAVRFECPEPEAHPDFEWYLNVLMIGMPSQRGLEADLREHSVEYHGGKRMKFLPIHVGKLP